MFLIMSVLCGIMVNLAFVFKPLWGGAVVLALSAIRIALIEARR
jgi:hypothetical protein